MRTDEKKYESIISNIDWALIGCAFVLSLVGLIAVYSTTLHTGEPATFVFRQMLALAIGLIFCILIIMVNYQLLLGLSYYIYGIGILLLVSLLFFGTQIRGTRAWFNLGFFYFQPVEITKLIFIIALSTYLSSNWKNIFRLNRLFFPMALLFFNVGLILLQPDFSSAIVYFPIFILMIYFAGANVWHTLHIVLFGVISAGIPLLSTYIKIKHPAFIRTSVGGFFYRGSYDINTALIILFSISVLLLLIWWFIHKLKIKLPLVFIVGIILVLFAGSFSSFVVSRSLKEYQRKRFIVFVAPEIDPLGAGYNIDQSKVAIGSGKFFGKGLFSGSQVGLGFLPEQHTDFIFSSIGEEVGFVGSSFILAIYFLFIWRILVIVKDSKDRGGSLVAIGIAVMFVFYLLINVGMTLGLAPVTGLPLPFLSYGGSAIVSAWVAVGILESIYSRRFTY